MVKSFKTECFPNQEQRNIIETNFGMRRFFFNETIKYLLAKYGDLKENARNITQKEIFALRKDLFRTQHKAQTALSPSVILDTTLEDVLHAINSLKKKGKFIEYRTKKTSNTCRYFRKTITSFRYESGSKYITTIKLKDLKMAEPIRWDNPDIRTLTIKKQANRYFISITCNIPDRDPVPNLNRTVGLDWGCKTYFTGYDGTHTLEVNFDEKILKQLDKRINKCQRHLSKKQEGSKNYEVAIAKLQQAYLDFNNYRQDFIYKVVKELNDDYDTVVLEDLGMRFVTSNRRLAKRAAQKPYYLFKVNIIHKFSEYGKKVYMVPKNYPSTQTCNSCGYVKKDKEKMKLGEHTYVCPSCGISVDRDLNAAMNIYSYRNLEEASIED